MRANDCGTYDKFIFHAIKTYISGKKIASFAPIVAEIGRATAAILVSLGGRDSLMTSFKCQLIPNFFRNQSLFFGLFLSKNTTTERNASGF